MATVSYMRCPIQGGWVGIGFPGPTLSGILLHCSSSAALRLGATPSSRSVAHRGTFLSPCLHRFRTRRDEHYRLPILGVAELALLLGPAAAGRLTSQDFGLSRLRSTALITQHPEVGTVSTV